MIVRVLVEVEVERISGKFISKDEIADEIMEAIEGSDPGSMYIDESEYETTSFEITQVIQKMEVRP